MARKALDPTGDVIECETPWCNEAFPTLRKGGNPRRFCTDACRERLRSEHRYARRHEPLIIRCSSRSCGAVFEHWKLGQHPKFCSTVCQINERDAKRRDVKAECVAYLGGACSRCGYDRCLGALHFHHIDPALKERKISDFARASRTSWEERRDELDKCDLLCANCHAEEHSAELSRSRGGRHD